jgi:rare lipoprotein A
MKKVYGICAAIMLAAMWCVGCQQAFAECGIASTYSSGTQTANGEAYNHMGISAAHKTLPFGTRVIVRNQRTGRSITVRINDRGPFVAGRIIDLSTGAKNALGMGGLAPVCLEVVSYGSGRKRGYEKPGVGGRLLEAVNTVGRGIVRGTRNFARGTILRSARGASRHTRHASKGTHRRRYAKASHRRHYAKATHRRRYATAAHRRHHATASHRRHYAKATHRRHYAKASHRRHHATAAHRRRYAKAYHRRHRANRTSYWWKHTTNYN